jgi:DNA-binding CsgD family transcriptional regulator
LIQIMPGPIVPLLDSDFWNLDYSIVIDVTDATFSGDDRRPDPLAWLERQGLTRREAEAALLAARGAQQREIGEQMGVSVGTVKATLAHALVKLGLATSRELMPFLLKRGVIGRDDLLELRPKPDPER